MPDYIIAYLGGREPDTPEEGAAQQQKWRDWLAGLGDAVVNPGTPLGPSTILSAKGVKVPGPGRLTGFSVVRAEDLNAALEMARACPFLEVGELQVAEMKSMA